MLTGRQKLEAALSGRGSPEVPVVIPYEDIFVRDHWEAVTDCPWWYAHSPAIEHQLAWRRSVIARVGQDWFALPLCALAADRESVTVEAAGDQAAWVDRRTGERRPLARPRPGGWAASGGLHSVRPTGAPRTPEEVDAKLPPVAGAGADAALAEGVGDLAAALLDEFGDRLYPVRSVSAPLWWCYDLWGFEGLMAMVALSPDVVAHACERYLERALRSVGCSAAIGARGIWIEDCLTDMVAPDAFRLLQVPFLSRLVDEIRALGMHSIYYYCGDPSDRWDLLFAVGADALSLEESKKGFVVEIEEVAERAAGRCAVFGNVDAIGVLERGTEEELACELSRQLACGSRSAGRFVMSLGSPVTPGTPLQRVQRYCELTRQLAGDARGACAPGRA